MYNRQRDLFKGYANLPDSFKQGTGTKDFAKLLARSWWYFVVPQPIYAALKPTPASDQDDEATHMAKEVAPQRCTHPARPGQRGDQRPRLQDHAAGSGRQGNRQGHGRR
jgi:hypothetical protein